MPTYSPFLQEAHINTIRTSAPLYMHDYSDLTKRNHMLLMMMAQWGNILYNTNAVAKSWKIKVREPQVRTFANTTNKTFIDHSAFEECTVGARGFEATDILKEQEWKENQGETQLINLYEFKMQNLAETIVKRIQEWIPRDGDSAAYQDGYQGFESCLGALNSGNGGSDPGNTDRIVLPSDTYAGHSTALGNFGGTWSTDLDSGRRLNQSQGADNDWPYGQGSSEYDAFSPNLWTTDATDWGAASWEDNCEKVVREAATALRNKNGMGQGAPDLCFLLAPNLYPEAENYYSSRFRIIQPYSGGDQGFPVPQSMHIDGVALKSDYSVPADIGYGIWPDHIEMFNYSVMNAGGPEPMIDVFGPTWSEEHGAYLMRVSTFGNLRMQPKFMCKLAPKAAYAG